MTGRLRTHHGAWQAPLPRPPALCLLSEGSSSLLHTPSPHAHTRAHTHTHIYTHLNRNRRRWSRLPSCLFIMSSCLVCKVRRAEPRGKLEASVGVRGAQPGLRRHRYRFRFRSVHFCLLISKTCIILQQIISRSYRSYSTKWHWDVFFFFFYLNHAVFMSLWFCTSHGGDSVRCMGDVRMYSSGCVSG